MTPTAIRSVDDVEEEAPARFLAGGVEDGADCARGAALPPDDFPEVRMGYFQLDDRGLFPLEGVNLHLVRGVDEAFGEKLDQVFQAVALFFLRIDFTVGES